MKKLLFSILSLFLIASMFPAAMAAEQSTVVSRQEIELENGVVIVDTLVEYTNARILGKAAKRTRELYANGVLIGKITLVAAFEYDGTTVSVTSKGVTEALTYEGWNYAQNSLTSSGGTVTLDARLTKLFHPSIPFTIIITCDANGNLS